MELENSSPTKSIPTPTKSTPAPTKSTPAKKVVDENHNKSSLHLECEEEPLSISQKNFYKEQVKNFNEQMKKLEELAKKGAQITNKGDGNVVFRYGNIGFGEF